MSDFFKKLLLSVIRGYQLYISPLHPGCCRYTPTCSAYAKEAIELYGPLKGVGMAMWRILRCNPFSRGGYDPVPRPAGENEQESKKTTDR